MEKTLKYTLTLDGAFPEETLPGGIQGEHRATAIIFEADTSLASKISLLKEEGKNIEAEIKAVTVAGECVDQTKQTGDKLFSPFYLTERVTSSGLDVIIVLKLLISEDQKEICKAQIKLCFTPSPVRLEFEAEKQDQAEQLSQKAEEITAELYERAQNIQKTIDQKLANVKEAVSLSANQLKTVKEIAKEASDTRLALESGSEFVFLGGDAFGNGGAALVIDEFLSETSHNPVANKTVAEAINKISTDYITERGTSGIWIYEKWASGKAECWAAIDTTITTTENNESGQTLYLGSSELWNFPANLFKNTPVCTYDTYGPGYPMTVINSLTNTSISVRYLTKWAVSGNARVSIIAKGKWK